MCLDVTSRLFPHFPESFWIFDFARLRVLEVAEKNFKMRESSGSDLQVSDELQNDTYMY